MSRIGIFYTACCPGTQVVAPTIPDFQGLSAASNIWLVNLIKLSFILVTIIMMYQIS